MYEQFYVFFVFFITVTRGQLSYYNFEEPQKVNVSIFYESLCPDSVRFITAKFDPVYEYMRSYINVRLIPFGKAEVISEKKYRCQHGPRECLRNRLQACVLSVLTDQDYQVKFVSCAMRDPNLINYERCAGLFGVDWYSVHQCADGTLGYKLMLAAEAETRNKTDGPTFVPTIVYNDVFDKEDNEDAFNDPLKVLCRKLSVKPSFCTINQQAVYLPSV